MARPPTRSSRSSSRPSVTSSTTAMRPSSSPVGTSCGKWIGGGASPSCGCCTTPGESSAVEPSTFQWHGILPSPQRRHLRQEDAYQPSCARGTARGPRRRDGATKRSRRFSLVNIISRSIRLGLNVCPSTITSSLDVQTNRAPASPLEPQAGDRADWRAGRRQPSKRSVIVDTSTSNGKLLVNFRFETVHCHGKEDQVNRPLLASHSGRQVGGGQTASPQASRSFIARSMEGWTTTRRARPAFSPTPSSSSSPTRGHSLSQATSPRHASFLAAR